MKTNMKNMIVIAVLALTWAACENKSVPKTPLMDAPEQETIVQENTEDSIKKEVENQIRAIYLKMKEMDASDMGLDTSELEKAVCSAEFLQLRQEVAEKCEGARSSEEIFTDEGWHWFPGIGTPELIDSIEVAMIQQDKVEARYVLTDKLGNSAPQHTVLVLEQGQWKIHDWIDAETYPAGSYLDQIKAFLKMKEGKK